MSHEFLLITWLVFGGVGCFFGATKNRMIAGLFLGLTLGIFGVVIVLFLKEPEPDQEPTLSVGGVLLIVVLLGGLAFWVASQRNDCRTWLGLTPSTTTQRPFWTTLAPSRRPKTVVEGQRAAVARFPELARAGSRLNSRFLMLARQRAAQNPGRMSDPDWPMALAEEANASLSAGR